MLLIGMVNFISTSNFHSSASAIHNLDLTNCKQVTVEEVKKNSVEYQEAERKVMERVKRKSFVFSCGYCEATFSKMQYLKEHVYGKNFSKTARKYKSVPCPTRMH